MKFDLNETLKWAGLPTVLLEKKAPADDADFGDLPPDDGDEGAPPPKAKDDAPASKDDAPAPKKDVPPAVSKFVTSGLAKKLVKAGLATDPEEDEGASLAAIATPLYDAGFKAGKAAAK